MSAKKASKSKSRKSTKSSSTQAVAHSANSTSLKRWHGSAQTPPKLEHSSWQVANAFAALLAVVVVLQLASFNDFAAELQALGLPDNAFWPALIVLAEILGIACLLRLNLSPLFRKFSATMLVAVSGFWFLLSLTALTRGTESTNIGIFGSFVEVEPSAWAVAGTALMLGISLYLANMVKGDK